MIWQLLLSYFTLASYAWNNRFLKWNGWIYMHWMVEAKNISVLLLRYDSSSPLRYSGASISLLSLICTHAPHIWNGLQESLRRSEVISSWTLEFKLFCFKLQIVKWNFGEFIPIMALNCICYSTVCLILFELIFIFHFILCTPLKSYSCLLFLYCLLFLLHLSKCHSAFSQSTF